MTRKTSKAQLKASENYNAKNTKMYPIKVNKKTEEDIYNILNEQENINAFVKGLIREYAKKAK